MSAVADVLGTVSPDDIVAWTRRFVRYPSPQTDRFEAEPQVQGFVADCVLPLVREFGLEARRDRMGSLIVEIGPRRAARSLMLMAYAMTHPAAAMADPYAGELADGPEGPMVRGRGVSEQKGSLAAALAAVAAAAKHGDLRGSLVFAVSTAGETGRHDAAVAILEELGYTPELGIIVLGTTSRMALGNKGRIDVDVTVGGKAAHSSMPWAGVNAIDGARQILNILAGMKIGGGTHPALGAATLTPTFIESFPRATHTVQDEVRITLDRRLLPGQKPAPALAEIRTALTLPPPWTVEVTQGPFMYPCEIQPDGLLARRIAEGCRRGGIAVPETFYSHGALDAGFLMEQGCEATMWGPGAVENWHSSEERLSVRALVDGAKGYYGLIRAHLG